MLNTNSLKSLFFTLLFVTTCLTAKPSESVAADDVSWARTDASVSLLCSDELVWKFNFGSDLRKPFFHPLNIKEVGTLTAEAPADHFWHHGLWFSWKLINGANYWEENIAIDEGAGLTSWEMESVKLNDDGSAHFVLNIRYHLDGQPPVLSERREIAVSPISDDNYYTIDWNADFKAEAETVKLDRRHLDDPATGPGLGGYAGLSVRLSQEAAGFEYVDSEGQFDGSKNPQPTRYRFRANAIDFAGMLPGSKASAGIAMLDHPDNLNAPSPWYVVQQQGSPMTYVNAAVIQEAPQTMQQGEHLKLKYRVIVHGGTYDAKKLKELYETFAK